MSYLSDEIAEAVSVLKMSAHRLPADETERIRRRLHDRFGWDPGHLGVSLGKESESLHHPEAWSWVSEFVGHASEAVLLFPMCDEQEAWIFPNGESTVSVLGECTGFIFFVTSQRADYLLAFDDHDCLIGAGTAAAWIRIRRASLE